MNRTRRDYSPCELWKLNSYKQHSLVYKCVRPFKIDHGTVETGIGRCQALDGTTMCRNFFAIEWRPKVEVADSQ